MSKVVKMTLILGMSTGALLFCVQAAEAEPEAICSLLHEAELKELHLTDATCIEKANDVSTNALLMTFNALIPSPLTSHSFTWLAAGELHASVGMTVLLVEVANQLCAERSNTPPPLEFVRNDVADSAAVESISICRGIFGNAFLGLTLNPMSIDETRKYFKVAAARVSTRERPMEIWNHPPDQGNDKWLTDHFRRLLDSSMVPAENLLQLLDRLSTFS